MSAVLEPEKDTILALKLMGCRKTATDEEFGKLLSELLGTCRHEGFRIAMKALQIILDESKSATPTCVHCEKPVTEPGLCHELHPAKYEHKGAGICLKHGAWQGPLTCPKCKVVAPQLREVSTRVESADKELRSLVPHIAPIRTKEDALAVHRANHPELYNPDGTRKGFEQQSDKEVKEIVAADILNREFGSKTMTEEELERVTRPDPPGSINPATGKARKIDDAGRASIRQRAKQARLDGQGRYPRGWVKRVAQEYDVSEALVYQIIYSDPEYQAIPKP